MKTKTIIERFGQTSIAVIGDVILDRYIFGKVERISPEAPIPIVQWHETMIVPGGAGNAAANITSLGGAAHIFGAVGKDREAEELITTLETHQIKIDGLLTLDRPTTEKTRVLGNHQQIVRIDHEVIRPISTDDTQNLVKQIESIVATCQAVLICDYAKGVVSNKLISLIREIAQHYSIPILADVKPENKDFYHHLDFITPNRKEAGAMAGKPIRNLGEAKTHGLDLARELETNILLTMSEEGLLLIEYENGNLHHLPTKAQEVTDVSGAGDTVIATFALALAAGADNITAATIANHAASIVVAKLGTATASKTELLETFK
jgi:rfaE bifunctional protein kinase chain/domain